MPEGDSIYRMARALHRALAGRTITRFESVFPHLTRIDVDAPIAGRTVERVEARGKHLLIWLSGDLVLRTHMRMSGSWHLYLAGERWQRPRHDMRIVLEAGDREAVAFNVPVAELVQSDELERTTLRDLGPDPLAEGFDARAAVDRLMARREMEIAEALLDQSAIAGIGNIYKSEILFAGRVNPFRRVGDLTREEIERLVGIAAKFLRANVAESASAMATYRGLRQTTGRATPGARFWVYARAGQPCRRCGTPVSRQRTGPNVRSTYWCAKCQPRR